MAMPPERSGPRRPVLAIITPWFPNAYEPIVGIFVGKQAEALSSEMEVSVIHVQMNCELLLWKTRDFFLRRRPSVSRVTSVVPQRVIYFPFRWVAKLVGTGLALRLLTGRIRRALRRLPQKADAALAWVSWPAGCAGTAAALECGITPAVMECNGGFPAEARNPKIRPHLHRLYTGPARQLTVSPLMTRMIHESLGCKFPAVEIGCVIDDRYFSIPLERPRRTKLRGLCVGAVYEEKGQHHIIAAAALLRDAGREDFEITCAGFGPGLEDFRRRTVDAGVQHLVKFPGVVTEDEKLRLYAESDFFVMPTLLDTFGAVVAEAMAAGLPVISTPNGSSEWIIDAQTGIPCRAGDPASLAAALTEMLDNTARFDRAVIRRRAGDLFDERNYTGRVRRALGI